MTKSLPIACNSVFIISIVVSWVAFVIEHIASTRTLSLGDRARVPYANLKEKYTPIQANTERVCVCVLRTSSCKTRRMSGTWHRSTRSSSTQRYNGFVQKLHVSQKIIYTWSCNKTNKIRINYVTRTDIVVGDVVHRQRRRRRRRRSTISSWIFNEMNFCVR